MTRKITQADILENLTSITLPSSEQNIVEAGLVSSVVVREHSIGFAIEFDEGKLSSEEAENLRAQAESLVKKVFSIEKVTAVLTAQRAGAPTQRQAKEELKQVRKAQKERHPSQPIKGVKHIIAVASGKGGVGKSTISVNLACAISALGHKVAIVDADIYGPSVPHMLGIDRKPDINEHNKMVPIKAHGLEAISIGCLIDSSKATVWRGPMVIKALFQLFRGTEWNDIDVMVVDMPPGTGDIQLSMADNIPLDGVVMVTTPQEVALLDVRKAADMFAKVQLPILGVVENMSYYEGADGEPVHLFGQGGGKRMAEALGVQLLGEVPLQVEYREAADNGEPLEKQILFHKIAEDCLKNIL